MPLELSVQDADIPGYKAPPKRGTSAYHTKDKERERQRKAAQERKRAPRSRGVPVRERRVIAWDGEGIKLRGNAHPQHYVLFGCSAAPDKPLKIADEKEDLDFFAIADYIVEIGRRFPHAIHVGYFFKYDHNMIVKSLPWPVKAALYEKNKARMRRGDLTYRISWIPGKSISITRRQRATQKKGVTVTIDDIGPFFASSFVKAYEKAFPMEERGDEWRTVVEGKQMRADTTYEDMPEIEHYWHAEILALERLAVWFRDLMCDAGFPLTKWYGPGALANLLRKTHRLAEHEWGGKVENMPPEVHDATKRAYFGGHVEQYLAGRVSGPIYVLDINSAYPAAFSTAPSLREGGEWRYRDLRGLSSREVLKLRPHTLTVIHARWHGRDETLPALPQPLPYRDARAEITYPGYADGWYWQPEVLAALYAAHKHKRGRVELLEWWEWAPAVRQERPWSFMEEMYERRAKLKRMGNPLEMAYKLGLNSMYGKMAQRAGWDTEKLTPPRSHTLPLAGFVTSWCRAEIMKMVMRLTDLDRLGVIAVETDGIFTTVDPAKVGVTDSTELGAWSVDVYDEMVYIQNGVYMLRQGDAWVKIKTRGMSANSVTPETLLDYLRTLEPEQKKWEPLTLPQGEVFIGLGAAISRATTKKGQIAWPKASAIHCRWEKQQKDVVPGMRGKRKHFGIPDEAGFWLCDACREGKDAALFPHTLRVTSTAAMMRVPSFPYRLPWERADWESEYQRLDRLAGDEIKREDT